MTAVSGAEGKFHGLIEPAENVVASAQNIGRAEFALSRTGNLSGKLVLAGRTYSVKGSVDDAGIVRFGRTGDILLLPRKGLSALQMHMQVDLVSAVPQLTGQIVDAGAPFAELVAPRDGYDAKHPVPLTLLNPAVDKGSYTGAFQALPAPNNGFAADQFPQGDGWTVLKLKPSGSLKMRGKLADGTKFAYASALNGSNGFPFYVPLYKNGGGVMGQLAFDTSGTTHLRTDGLTWFRPVQATPLYPQGWPTGIGLGFDGAARNVATEPNVLPPGNATVTLTGGNLPPPGMSSAVTIAPNNRVTIAAADGMQISLKANGQWTGRFTHPTNAKRTAVEGVVLRDPAGAVGFFIGPTESGHASIQPTP
jgi:hypothetical protein